MFRGFPAEDVEQKCCQECQTITMLELIIPVYIFSEIISTLKKKLAIPSKLKIASAEKSAENPQKKTEPPLVLRSVEYRLGLVGPNSVCLP